jgi:hypothetical protein
MEGDLWKFDVPPHLQVMVQNARQLAEDVRAAPMIRQAAVDDRDEIADLRLLLYHMQQENLVMKATLEDAVVKRAARDVATIAGYRDPRLGEHFRIDRMDGFCFVAEGV